MILVPFPFPFRGLVAILFPPSGERTFAKSDMPPRAILRFRPSLIAQLISLTRQNFLFDETQVTIGREVILYSKSS